MNPVPSAVFITAGVAAAAAAAAAGVAGSAAVAAVGVVAAVAVALVAGVFRQASLPATSLCRSQGVNQNRDSTSGNSNGGSSRLLSLDAS